jgi:hypothetical protein
MSREGQRNNLHAIDANYSLFKTLDNEQNPTEQLAEVNNYVTQDVNTRNQ